ncbi:MAG: cobyric acid synthase CobQ, partial [Methanobacteriota archaeon]
LDIAVIKFPRISNFTDFDPLIYEGFNVRYVERAEELGQPNAVVLPGTKNTIEDLSWLRERGFEEKIKALQVPVIGICGGYQMLGRKIIDSGIESERGVFKGLGLLDVETRFEKFKKKTEQVEGKIIASHGIFSGAEGTKISGYEIHMGRTKLGRKAKPIFNIKGKKEGAVDDSGLVFGTYLHALFDSPSFRKSFIEFIQFRSRKKRGLTNYVDVREAWMRSIERASQVVQSSLDMRAIKKIIEAQDD